MTITPDNPTSAPPDDILNISPPLDATELLNWSHTADGLARRPFVGTVREVSGFAVRIEGIQRENRTCSRRVIVETQSPQTQLELEAVRQLAAALTAAANEIEARR